MAELPWSKDLQCHWIRWHQSSASEVRLDLPENECCDMNGAIRTAKVLMPRVSSIQTYEGGLPSTLYQRRGNEWTAFDVRDDIG